MKISAIADVLQKAAIDMRAFSAKNDDVDLPDQVVLPFITRFLTDEGFRQLSADGPGTHLKRANAWAETALDR